MRFWTTESEVRPLEPEEYEELIRLLCVGFRLDYHLATNLFYQDPQLEISQRWGLWIQEGRKRRLASVLTVIPAPIWVGKAVVPTAGIAGVTTHPELRGRGYASRLLTTLLQPLFAQGYQATALLPFDHQFYRRLGWETVGTLTRLRLPPDRLPKYPESTQVRPCEQEDLPALQHLHSKFTCHRTGAIRRDAQRWAYLLWNNRHKWVIGLKGQVEGYLFYDLIEDGNGLRVREFIWSTEEARRGLIGALARNPERVRWIEFNGTPADLQRLGLAYLQENSPPEKPLAVWEIMPGFMWRVVNAPALLETLLASITDPPSPLPSSVPPLALILRDPYCPWQEQPIIISTNDSGNLHLVQNAEPLSPIPIKMGIRLFSLLAIGGVEVQEALARGWLRAPDAVIPALKRMFPYRQPCLIPSDYF